MLYCEKCYILTEEKHCPMCGYKKLREVTDKDFCFFRLMDKLDFGIFENSLKENHIDVTALPYYPLGVTYFNAGRATGRKMYIRYKDSEIALRIYNELFCRND